MDTYLVGGALRDELLGQPVTDRDWVVVGTTDEEMREAGYLSVGKNFPVYLHPETREEYALARQEKKTGAGHQGFVFETRDVSLEEDLVRRDLTINAIAQDTNGNLIDPVGGRADIEARVLRHISPAFSEDPLRVLRVARFAARFHNLGFRIADETLALMSDITADGELDTLSAERVVEEARKALTSPHPIVFFQVLEVCGAHATLWPEIDLNVIPEPIGLQIAASPSLQWAAMMSSQSKDVATELDRRLPLPSLWTQQALDILQLQTQWSDVVSLSSADIVDMLYQLDSFRQKERLEISSKLLVTINNDLAGARDFHETWMAMMRSTQSISATEVMAKQPTLKGGAIGSAIRAARIEKLQSELGR